MITHAHHRFSFAAMRMLSGLALSLLVMAPLLLPLPALAQGTAQGEIEARASAVARRHCLGGTSVGNLCNEDTDCPGSTCTDTNIFGLSVAVHYDAPPADLTAIQNLMTNASASIFDATDGQAEIGVATIHNNAFGTTDADLRVYPQTCSSGTSIGAACTNNNDCLPNAGANPGRCGVWWWANTGSFRNAGSMHVSIDNVIAAGAGGGSILAHEFTHLIFDARDEYETRPGCANGNWPAAACPDAGAGQPACLMDDGNDELCWGQGDSTDVTDISGGNHDATNVTEQSECRNNRSCWDQLVWSWPSVILKPAAAPDAAANGLVVGPTNFFNTSDEIRVVLVLDESGSMDLESPKRIARLQVAAKDFIALADDDAEVGIVSYSDDAETASGRVNVAIDTLSNNRVACNNAIDGLSTDARTNIGDGLEKAKDMIVAAGGVTANTFVVLMTDGRNNEPKPQATADADLTAKIADLLAAGIPVYVTCTGSDPGLDSQCSEIAAGTGGFYVDSADAATLPEAFVEYHERITGHEAIDSMEGDLAKLGDNNSKTFYVDQGSEAATFTIQWHDASVRATMTVIDPGGANYQTVPMPQGRFFKVNYPQPGDWTIRIDPSGGASGRFVVRAFTRHRSTNLPAAVRFPSVPPGEEIFVFAYPKNMGRSVTHPTDAIVATVTLPDGSRDTLELLDQGRDASGRGDDVGGDGIFTGVYKNTAQTGPYNFLIRADIEGWLLGHDAHEYRGDTSESTRFVREVRLTASVGDPREPVPAPEDGPPGVGGDRPLSRCCRIVVTLLVLALLLLLIIIFMIWRCCCSKRMLG